MFQSYNQDRRQQLVVANTSHSDIITYTADSDNSRALQLFSNSELVQSSNGQINADKDLHSPDFNDCDSPDVLSVVEFLDKTIEIVNSSV